MNEGRPRQIRDVRPLPGFYQDLRTELTSERGPSGQPSYEDFLLLELPRILRVFATEWELLSPLVPGRPDYRVLMRGGRVVFAIAVEAQLSRDGVVELITITVDTSWPDPYP